MLLVDRPKPKQAVLSGVSPLREVHVEQNPVHHLLCQYRKKRVGRSECQYPVKLTGQADLDRRKNRRIVIYHHYCPVICHIRFVCFSFISFIGDKGTEKGCMNIIQVGV